MNVSIVPALKKLKPAALIVVATFLGLFLRMWPFRSHLLLRLGVAVITFSGGAILLYSAAQLAETLR